MTVYVFMYGDSILGVFSDVDKIKEWELSRKEAGWNGRFISIKLDDWEDAKEFFS